MKKKKFSWDKYASILLAICLFVHTPLSALANTSKIAMHEEQANVSALFTQEISEDKKSVLVQMELTAQEGVVLKEVILPDGVSVYPETRDGITGFRQEQESSVKNRVEYAVLKNENVKFIVSYSTVLGESQEMTFTYDVNGIQEDVQEDTKEDSTETKEETNKDSTTFSNSAETPSQYFIFVPTSKTIIGYTSSVDAPKDVVIPRQINGVDVEHIGERAFAGQQITSITLHDGILTIADEAFRHNSLTDVQIPDSVTSIGSSAFEGNGKLSSLQIGSGVTKIGNRAFYSANITNLQIPDNVTTLGAYAFFENPITSLTIGSGITRIEESTFYKAKISDVVIPDSITYIGESAFQANRSLTSVTLSSNLTSIGDFAFNDTALQHVTIPNLVQEIGDSAFAQNANLASIMLGNALTTIGSHAFKETKITSLTIPNSVSSIGVDAFLDSDELLDIQITTKDKDAITGAPWGAAYATVYWSNGETDAKLLRIDPYIYNPLEKSIVKYTGVDKNVVISETLTYNGKIYPVEIIGANAFSQTQITGVTLPDSVTEIQNNAFSSNTNLTSVTFGSGITKIGELAFSYTGLTSISIPDTVVHIGANAFSNINTLSQIHIPTKYPNEIVGAPWGADSSVSIYWKSNNTSCFYVTQDGFIAGLKPLQHDQCIDDHQTIHIPNTVDGVQIVGILDNAFKGKGINTLTFESNSSVQTIKRNAFAENNITSLVLPDSVLTIEEAAFADNTSLTSLVLGNSVTTIGAGAFSGNGLNSVIIPDSVLTIEAGAFQNTLLTSLILGSNVREIKENAFKGTSLVTIDIPDSVVIIENNAFSTTTLLDINIPTKNQGTIDGAPWGAEYAQIHWMDQMEDASIVDIAPYKFNRKTNTILQYIGSAAETLEIPSILTYDGQEYPVNVIESKAFSRANIKNVVISDGIKTIGTGAFLDNRNLRTVKIGDGVTHISNAAFDNCSALQSIEIGKNVKFIGDKIIGKSKVKSIIIPENVETITNLAFANALSLAEIRVMQVRDTSPIKNNQPWGARTDTKVLYLGEFPVFTHTVERNDGEHRRTLALNVNVDKGHIIELTLPDGKKETIGKRDHDFTYDVFEDGEYTFQAIETTGVESVYKVVLDDIGEVEIDGNDFEIPVNVAPNATIDQVIQLANATATDKDTKNSLQVQISDSDLEKVKALTNEGEQTTITISATSDKNKSASKEITVTATSAKVNVTVSFDSMGGSAVNSIQVQEGEKVSKPNPDPTKLGYVFDGWYKDTQYVEQWNFDQDRVEQIDITLYAKWEEDDMQTTLTAEDVILKASEAKVLQSKEDLIPFNKAVVTLGDNTKKIPEEVITNSNEFEDLIQKGIIGSYEVTYRYRSLETSAKVTIVDDESIVDQDRTESIYAQNAIISQTEAKALLDERALIDVNSASAVLANGNAVDKNEIQVGIDTDDFAKIKAGEIGSYEVTYMYNTVSKTVKVTVVKDGSEIDQNRTESIYAEDGEITQTQAKQLANVEALIPHNKASVTLADGTETVPTGVMTDFATIQTGAIGEYEVTYSYNTVSKKVVIKVIADGTITAENAIISQTEAKALANKEALIPYNKASVTLADGSRSERWIRD